jgi:hypothetical protein
VASAVQARSRRGGCLYAVTHVQPTNYDMLIFRTLNQLLKAPGHNADYVAAQLRDRLMPVRCELLESAGVHTQATKK